MRVVVHTRNRGYGDAVRSGIAAARMPWVLLTDADLQFDLAELEDFLPARRSADILVGWRILRRDPLNRRLNASAWNWLVRRMFHLPVRDVDCAFKLVRRDLLERFTLEATGAMISTELVVKSPRRGRSAARSSASITGRASRASSSGASPRVVARAFRELALLRRSLRAARP